MLYKQKVVKFRNQDKKTQKYLVLALGFFKTHNARNKDQTCDQLKTYLRLKKNTQKCIGRRGMKRRL